MAALKSFLPMGAGAHTPPSVARLSLTPRFFAPARAIQRQSRQQRRTASSTAMVKIKVKNPLVELDGDEVRSHQSTNYMSSDQL